MKKIINRIHQFILSNKVIFILFAIYIAFHSFFEKHITALLVDTFLCYIVPTWYNDSLTIITFAILLFDFMKSIRRNSYIANHFVVLSSLFFLIIGYYRFCSDVWTFTPLFTCNGVKYVDVALLFCVSIITLRLSYRKRKYSCNAEGFFFDSPIQSEGEDTLNRSALAEVLAKKITNTVDDTMAFAVGICSEWGQGKTSFLKLIKEKLDEKNKIIVDFNTWLNNDEYSIVSSFFDELSKNLKPYNRELSKDLVEYAKILSATENNFIEKIRINHSSNLSEKFEIINDKIKKSGKQIVVFIDDLDRLYAKEIVEVLRLIRNSANFANTVFIVAYDRNYVISALKQLNEYRSNFYLEKIFQLEIMLPKFEKHVIALRIITATERFLTDKDKEKLEKLLYESRFNYSMLSSIRDINRFVNSFLLSYKVLEGEIELLDLLHLELLRIKYLGVYELLSKSYDKFLEYGKDYSGYHLCLKALRSKDNNTESILAKTELEEYLENHYEDVGIQKNQIGEVIRYVKNIFPNYATYTTLYGANYKLLSITNPVAINRYFHYSLLNSNLSEKNFSEYRQKPEKEFQAKIEEWVNNGLDGEVSSRLERIDFFEDKEDYKKIINTIFFYASLPTKNDKNRILNFDNEKLLSKLTYENAKIFYNTKEEFKVFVAELFNSQKSPYLFPSELINKVFYESAFNERFVLSKEELVLQTLNYFKQYVEEITAIDIKFFWLYHYCGYTEWVESGNNSRSSKEQPPIQKAKDIFKQCAKRLIDNFLKNIITKDVREQNHYAITNVICNVWDSWDNFEKFLLEFDEKQVQPLKEFKDFFYKCKEVNFKRYIEYKFNEIDLTNALLCSS